tara:strand:+ start:500 stop:2011 length:1512 start_codon:yes stop_codon:yes gene_type:complete
MKNFVIFIKIIVLCSITTFNFYYSQFDYKINSSSLPMNAIVNEFNSFIKSNNADNNKGKIKSLYNISFKTEYVYNSGHPNIDNSAELFSPSQNTSLISFRFDYQLPWLIIELEPFIRNFSDISNSSHISGNYGLNNNHSPEYGNNDFGFRQSRVILHYKGIGIGYGRMSHWWGPGFHSAIALSSNAPSQISYSLGTHKDISFGKFRFGSQIIVMPYKNSKNVDLYFSGLKTHITYNSNPKLTFGFHRTFLSGDFDIFYEETNFPRKWSIEDATRLVIEPLFGKSKQSLDYTIPNTPGFDRWDEVLTGFVKLYFPDDNLELYVDIASDDNRANFTDLRAHWDHTLGYLIGFKKFYNFNKKWKILFGTEYLTTRISNTLKKEFYRGNPNQTNYYSYIDYDYFSYEGRRMGAHSGTSSDDLIFMLGIGSQNKMIFFTYNKERHGIKKEMSYPENKTEFNISYRYKFFKNQTLSITFEHEKVNNYSFISNKNSKSMILWFSYAYSLN